MSPQRGDIVLVRHGTQTLVKRVVGLPDERVEIRSGHVLINGDALAEPYVLAAAFLEPQSDCRWSLALDRYIVLGDARDDSLDSRRFGPVSEEDMIGIVSWRLWPPTFTL